MDTLDSEGTTATVTTPSTPMSSCPDGWEEFDGNCFKFFKSAPYSWYVADAKCLEQSSRLTSVHSEEEDNFLKELSDGNSYWMGGYPQGISWVWSDFTGLDYTNFYSAEPGLCTFQSRGHYEDGWGTASCSSTTAYYICKLVKQN